MAAVGGSSSRGLMKRPSIRRVFSFDNLPQVRYWFHGPRWRRHFEIDSVPVEKVAPISAGFHRPGAHILIATLEEDIRELICEPIGPNKYAMWSDPREHFNLKKAKTAWTQKKAAS